jgi:Flp pilus assembly protein TadB
MSVHYENNAPFLTITNLERVIEVSHWGNIAVEETIDLKHSGASLKGPFSRYEYQRETQSGLSSVKSFKVIIIMLSRCLLIYVAGNMHTLISSSFVVLLFINLSIYFVS